MFNSLFTTVSLILSILFSTNSFGIEPHYKIGSKYTINNVTYYPHYYEKYERIGIASWYGPGFHGKKTANGEVFNKNKYTAAHRTLPLPSIVRVTNLENNKSLILKVNDRGPFVKGRIIDVSEKSAIYLGFKNKGKAKVKVTYLKKQTEDFIKKNKNYEKYYKREMEKLKKSKKNTNPTTKKPSQSKTKENKNTEKKVKKRLIISK